MLQRELNKKFQKKIKNAWKENILGAINGCTFLVC